MSFFKSRQLGLPVLGVYLVAIGVMRLASLSFAGSETVLALLALAAGVLILLGR